tara:strand:+ start:782 stop:1321 length:540 start_codon:yes stop_codon:yes gene_type:complete
MAKLTSQQRDYFKDRIKNQFDNHLGPLEKMAAVKKAEFVDEKFEDFIDDLGLRKNLDELEQVEARLQAVQQSIGMNMTNLQRQYELGRGYNNYEWSWSMDLGLVQQVKKTLHKMCRKECEIAFKEFPEGQKIEQLKNKRREALDYIYGYDQQKELLDGLAAVLANSGVKMLEVYNGKKS